MAPHGCKRYFRYSRHIGSARMSKKAKGDFLEVNGLSENGAIDNPCKYTNFFSKLPR